METGMVRQDQRERGKRRGCGSKREKGQERKRKREITYHYSY